MDHSVSLLRRARSAARTPVAHFAPLLLLLACASSGPEGPLMPPENAQTVGEGECWVEVVNRSSGRLELYYWVGLGDPPNNPRSWPTIGFLAVGRTLVVKAPCDQAFVNVWAMLLGSENPSRRDIELTGRERLSNEGPTHSPLMQYRHREHHAGP